MQNRFFLAVKLQQWLINYIPFGKFTSRQMQNVIELISDVAAAEGIGAKPDKKKNDD